MGMAYYNPITKQARESRYKKTVPALVSATPTTLVSSAISGQIRHIVDVHVQPISGAAAVYLMAADASGLTSIIDRGNWGPKLIGGSPSRFGDVWKPENLDAEHEFYQLQSGEKLMVAAEAAGFSSCAYVSATFWDEGR
jgi:hypothetical protein